jgi:predicted PurR-regulated permease PerM
MPRRFFKIFATKGLDDHGRGVTKQAILPHETFLPTSREAGLGGWASWCRPTPSGSEATFARFDGGALACGDVPKEEIEQALTSKEKPSEGPPRGARQARALDILALVAVAALIRLASPVGVGLFLGALLGFTLQPLYERLRLRGWGGGAAALTCTLGAMTLVSTAAVSLAVLFVTRGVALVSSLPGLLAPGGAVRGLAERLNDAAPLHVDPNELATRLEQEALSLGARAAEFAGTIAGTTFSGLLTVFFMTLTAYSVLRHWTHLVRRLELTLPLERRHTHALLDQFRKVGREVLWGTVVTGLLQGLFAAVGYWITGAPQPVFFGALTAVASLVPAVGTLLVWIPMGILRMMTGHVASGLILLIYSALVVGVASDYFIRPRLVGSDKNVPVLLTFVSLFGGVEVFGLVGLALGPVIVTLSIAVLKTYQTEVIAARGGTEDVVR